MRIIAIIIRYSAFSIALSFYLLALLATANEFEKPSAKTHPQTTLITPYGDNIPGTWLTSDISNIVNWQVDGLVDPLQFEAQHLTALKVHHTSKIPTVQGTYRCELINGDILQGTPVDINDNELVLEVPDAGKIRIDRKQLYKLSPWRGAGKSIKSTPSSLKDWDGDQQAWREAAGRISAIADKAELTTSLRLGNKSQLSLRVAWRRKPDFRIDFGSSSKWDWGLRLETWQNQLVLVAESPITADIMLIKHLKDKADQVSLNIFVNTREQKILVTSETGNKLGEFAWEGGFKNKFRIQARKAGLRFHSAIVTPWDGFSPIPHDATKPKVYSKDGTSTDASINSWDPDTNQWTYSPASNTTENESRTKTIDSDQLDSITFGNTFVTAHQSLQAISRNGMRISGNLLKYNDHTVWLNSELLKDPIALPIENLGGLVFMSDTKLKTTDVIKSARLVINETTISGQLINSPIIQQTSALLWKPTASKNASLVANSASGSIIYRDTPTKKAKKKSISRTRARGGPQQPAVIQGFVRLFGADAKAKPVKSIARISTSGPTLHLRSGDSIPCHPKRIDSKGITFSSPATDATFAPHNMVKALVLVSRYQPARVTKEQRERLLTLPRIQQEYPPKHLLLSTDGDLLRARLIAMDDENIGVEVRLNPVSIRRSKVAAISWLHEDEMENADEEDNPEDEQEKNFLVQAIQSDGIRLTIQPKKFAAGVLHGNSKVFGNCHVDVSQVDRLVFGNEIEQELKQQSHQLLVLKPAIVPRFVTAEPGEVGADAGKVAALVGKEAPPIKLKQINGVKFDLDDYRGKVVVLDFWASWCGPCVQWMPQLEELVAKYDEKDVELITINLMEDVEVVKKAFERMQVNPTTLLDIDGVVAEAYQATAIPQTVVINQQGIVERLFIGGSPQIKQPLIEALDELTTATGAE